MKKISLQIGIIFFMAILSACSSNNIDSADIDNSLIIPPSLTVPEDITPSLTANPQPISDPGLEASVKNSQFETDANSLYYIIVGTYPNQTEAITTFARISSLNLKQPAMESRRTKSGTLLHMVRLGPYSKQADIDEAKNGLTNSGISGFKLVKS